MNPHNNRPDPYGVLPVLALLGACAVGLLAWWPVVTIAALRHIPLPANPVSLAVGLGHHTVTWPGRAVVIIYAAQGLLLVIGSAFALGLRLRRHATRTRADSAARSLSRPGDLVGLTPAHVAATARRLRPGQDLHDPDSHGVLLAETLVSRMPLRMSWEDITVVIAGPRVGKTTAAVVPAVVGYTGPVKTSSNKPDVHDATREPRDLLGTCWVCDPQRMLGGDPSAPPLFWWNPLADVTSVSRARELVQILVDTTVDPGAKPDAYFHPTGMALLTHCVFAAALAGKTLLDVDHWLGDIEDPQPTAILREHGFASAAAQVHSVIAKPDRQRDGVFGTAQSWLAVIADPRYAVWLTPPPAGEPPPPQFCPDRFVRSAADTMYLLSQEGPASAAFITTALNAAIDRAAIHLAQTSPTRRLTTPLLSVLDEAANTIRDTALPDKVSHYGSRGLPTMIVLQSWSQGVAVWGERGMRKLWSAANITLYLGGVAETEFLKALSDLLGDRDERYWTSTRNHNERGSATSRAEQVRRIPILSVAQLASLPRGRALLLSSGNRPTLGRPVPWMTGPHAAAITTSLARWESADRRAERGTETTRAIAETHGTERSDDILRGGQVAAALVREGATL